LSSESPSPNDVGIGPLRGARGQRCLGYEGDFDRGYQVDEDSVSQVKVGATTKPEALTLLGLPCAIGIP
jgi:outer membrane protein assembly factor BamE (lipoprotein component of BamABCDE complex)